MERGSTSTRERLITATLELIDAQGWPAVTLTGVARACGLTTPACYKHFPSKTSLFQAALKRLSTDLGERAAGSLQEDPAESLLAIGLLLVELAEDHPRLFEFNQLSPVAIAAVADPAAHHPLLATIRREVERLAATRGADPDPLHLIIWSCLQGYTQLIAAGATTADPEFMRRALHAAITIGDHP
nr:TetR/AcrR family transcriptional regulator [Actinomyces bowdenii]